MSPAYSPTAERTYAPSCEEVIAVLASVGRRMKRDGTEVVLTGITFGQNGGLAVPRTDADCGTVETFRDFVRQLGSEGIAGAVETEVTRPAIATGTHSYLVREPIVDGGDMGQFARLDIRVTREEGKGGRLHYEATLAHSCSRDERKKAKNGRETDPNLWVELSSVFLG